MLYELKEGQTKLEESQKTMLHSINQLERKASHEEERRMRFRVAPQMGEDNVQPCEYDELISPMVRYVDSGEVIEGKVVYSAKSTVIEAAIEEAEKRVYPYSVPPLNPNELRM